MPCEQRLARAEAAHQHQEQLTRAKCIPTGDCAGLGFHLQHKEQAVSNVWVLAACVAPFLKNESTLS